jgi:ATP-dependent Clp protease ATP-binding subunit ClpA
MAKKKTARDKAKPNLILSNLQRHIKRLQRDAEAVLSKTRKETARLGQDQKRALQRVVTEVKRLRGDFGKAVKQTSKDLESQSKRFMSSLQKEATTRLDPLLKQLVGRDAGVREEIQILSRRVQELEQLVTGHSHTETPAAVPKQPSLFPPEAPPPSTDE